MESCFNCIFRYNHCFCALWDSQVSELYSCWAWQYEE